MTKNIYLLGFALVFSINSIAQINPSVLYSSHLRTVSSKYIPSRIGEDIDKGEFVFLFPPLGGSLYLNVANTTFGGLDILNFATKGSYTTQDVKDLVGKLKTTNNLAIQYYIQPLAVSWWVKKNERKVAAFNFSVNAITNMNVQVGEVLFKTIFEGNKQYAGQRVNLSNAKVNALGYVEFGLGAAVPLDMLDLSIGASSLKLKPSFRAKYLMAFAGAQTKRSDLYMTTAATGEYIDFDYDYAFNAAIPVDNGFGIQGHGAGFDLGLQADIDRNITASISFIDMGKINFNGEVRNFTNKDTNRFEGVNVDVVDLVRDANADISLIDALDDILEPIETNNSFSMNTGAQMIMHLDYRLMELQMPTSGLRWHKHNFSFTYVQGFKTQLHVTTRPLFGLSYMLNCKNKFNVGVNATFLGNNKIGTFGAFISAQGGPVKFGIGFDHLMGPVGSGFGFSYNLLWSF